MIKQIFKLLEIDINGNDCARCQFKDKIRYDGIYCTLFHKSLLWKFKNKLTIAERCDQCLKSLSPKEIMEG